MCELTASGLVAGGGCSTASWSSSTSVSCVSGSASGQLGTSSVTVGAVAGTGQSVYSFDAPVARACDAEQSHRAGAELCDSERAELREWASTQHLGCCRRWVQHVVLDRRRHRVHACSGSAAGARWVLEVTVGAVAGTGLSVYSFDAPVVVHCDAEQSHRAGGAL